MVGRILQPSPFCMNLVHSCIHAFVGVQDTAGHSRYYQPLAACFFLNNILCCELPSQIHGNAYCNHALTAKDLPLLAWPSDQLDCTNLWFCMQTRLDVIHA